MLEERIAYVRSLGPARAFVALAAVYAVALAIVLVATLAILVSPVVAVVAVVRWWWQRQAEPVRPSPVAILYQGGAL